jgi:hypothetical protein
MTNKNGWKANSPTAREHELPKPTFAQKVWHFIIGTIGLSAFWALVLGGIR